MNNTKTLELLKLFNQKELKKLTEFISTSYFNKEKNVFLLYKYLLANLNIKTTREEAFQFIYKDESFNLGRLNYLSTTLYNLLKKFIAIENTFENENFYDESVLKLLRNRNQKHLYQLEETLIVNKSLKTKKLKSVDYQRNYLFEYERLNFYAEEKRTETKYIENLHFNLDAYYLIEKLKAACASLNQQKLYKTKMKQSFTRLLIDYIEKTQFQKEVPLLSIYFNAYKMLLNNKKDDFKKLKQNLEDFQFEVKEINDAFLFGLNFCIQQMNAGNSDFNIEVFEMYQTGVEKSILLNQGKLLPITFSNIVTIGLRLKRFKEVEVFIEQKNKLLSGSEKKSYYAFNLAKVYFEKGEFEKVTDLYNEKLIKEVLLNIQMRILQIKAFYELNEIEIFESLVISTDQLLNRKGILAYHKAVFKNFIKFCKALLIINKYDKKSVLKLQDSIISSTQLIDKDWLISKLKD